MPLAIIEYSERTVGHFQAGFCNHKTGIWAWNGGMDYGMDHVTFINCTISHCIPFHPAGPQDILAKYTEHVF